MWEHSELLLCLCYRQWLVKVLYQIREFEYAYIHASVHTCSSANVYICIMCLHDWVSEET